MRILAALLVVFTSTCIFAQSNSPYQEGTHYLVLDVQVPLEVKGKIEVAEYFSYTCGACFSFETASKDWKETLPDDAEFVYLPSTGNEVLEILARSHYAAKTLNVLDKVHKPIFDMIHVDRKIPRSEEEIAELVAKQGVDKEQFLKMYKSFTIGGKYKQAESRANLAKMRQTPTLIVNGKYVVETDNNGGFDGMMKVASYLVDRIRAGEM